MDYYLSNDTLLATIEAISKTDTLVYLGTELPICEFMFFVDRAWLLGFYISSELFRFVTMMRGQTISLRLYSPWWDRLVVQPRDYQLRHLAVIPLRVCIIVRQRPE